MKEKDSYSIYNSKTPEEIKQRILKIAESLEFTGRYIYDIDKDRTSRILSRHLKSAVDDGKIVFGWNPYSKKGAIAINPLYKLVKIGNTKVKFLLLNEKTGI